MHDKFDELHRASLDILCYIIMERLRANLEKDTLATGKVNIAFHWENRSYSQREKCRDAETKLLVVW